MEVLQTTTKPLVSHGMAPAGKAFVPRAALLAAALLSVIVGVSLLESLGVERSGPLPARHRAAARSGLSSLPVAAQGPVSAALGARSPAYRVSASGGELRAQNTPQRLHVRFRGSGVSLSSGAAHVGLSLRGVGYGASLRALGDVTPRASANRVSYARAGLSEWYVNGPLGLEQGFTIPRVPSGHPAGALTLAMALSGNAQASPGAGGQSISFSRNGEPVLRYSGLRATDARGRVLPSSLALHGRRLELRVDTRGARYPVRIDPFVQQGGKLTGAGESGKGLVGFGVAVSPDGNTALVGGPGDNKETGAAWVFTRSGSVWTEQAKLTGASEIGAANFGFSVALATTKGDTAIIGGPFDNSEVGAAWVFTRSGTTWTQQAKLTGAGELGKGLFGTSVALAATESTNGTALVGAREDNTKVGAAWVFTRSGTTWSEQAKLTGAGETGAGKFGVSAALSSDGNTAMIGGPGDNSFLGAAWVFTRSGSIWTQQGSKLTGSEEISAPEFGAGVALSSDGNTALIGGPGDNLLKGAAWAFTRSGSTWTQQGGKLTASDETGKSAFGAAVALSATGNTAVIGGPEDNTRVGAAWFFARSSSTWFQQGNKRIGTGETGTGENANSVALSSEGNTALLGASGDNTEVGAAFVFVFQNPSPPAVVTKAATSVNQTLATMNATVNPNGAELTKCEFEYGETTAYGKTAPCTPSAFSVGQGESPVEVQASVSGLNPNTTYHYRITATNTPPGGTTQGADETFKTLALTGTPPTVEIKPATGVVAHTATMNAMVNPNGGNVYECTFEYGETTSSEKTAKCASLPGSGTSPVAVSATVSGLAANTTYHYKITALNPGGTGTSTEETFKTTLVNPPAVVSAAASSVTQTSATLNASVNPNEGEVSKCEFEWGETTAYGKIASCSALPGAGTSPVAVSAPLSALTNKTTYHYRISATNPGGTTTGADHTVRAASVHVYKNGVKGVEAKKVRTIGWGTLKLSNAALGEVECHYIMTGFVENPTGGASAVGQLQAFGPYECVSASCTAMGGSAIEVTPEKAPWAVELTESEEGGFRMRSGNKLKSGPAVFLRVNCVGKINALFTGEFAPKLLNNGLTIGAVPAEVEFDAGAGELENEPNGPLKYTGKFKTEGYGAQELIEVQNP